MDCHKWTALALGLCFSAAGCVTHQTGPTGVSETTKLWSPFAGMNNSQRLPKAETCVAGGYFREREAESPRLSPVEREQMLDSARRAYQQALEIDPDHLDAYIGLARVYCTLKDYERALATYDAGLKKHPRAAKLWYELGMCQARMKNFEKANECFKKCVEIDPENRSAVATLGHSLARSGRIDDSLMVFTRLYGQAQAHYKVAQMLQHLNQPQLAQQHLYAALQADPNLNQARTMLAQMEQGQQAGQDVSTVGYQTPMQATPVQPYAGN